MIDTLTATARFVCCIAVAGALCALGGSMLHAQTRPPLGSPLPGIQSPPPPSTAPATPPPAPVAPAAVVPGQVFGIDGVTINGATAYGQARLAPLLDGLTGPAVPLERIEAARAALLNLYRRDGYTYTAVRARIHERQLRIAVIEPHIVGVKLSQDIGPAGTLVLGLLQHLADGRLLRAGDLERWVLLANDVPGVTVHVILDPSTNDPGALSLRAQVTRQAFGGSIRADNRAFRQTGPEELLAVADANSFSSWGERTELSIYHTFNNTDTFGQASEEFFVGTSGLKLRIYGGAGESIPSGSLRLLGYDGVTRVFGAALTYPVIRARRQDLVMALQFDGVESDIAYTNQGPSKRASFDSLRVISLDATDTLSDLWVSPQMPATNVGEVTFSQGVPNFGASTNGNPQLPRLNERVDFTKANARLERTQVLFHPYRLFDQPATVQMELAAEGQFTNNILPPEEEFYLGGPSFNRGFYYGEVTGDRALTTKIEPQLATPLPPVPGWGPGWRVNPQAVFYGFFDWGETWQQQRTDASHILRSLGGGVRLSLDDHAEIDLEGVSRLTRTPEGGQNPRLKSSAFYWQVIARF